MWTERRRDVVLAAGIAAVLVVLNGPWPLAGGPGNGWLAAGAAIAGSAALIWRREHPTLVFAVLAPAFIASVLWHLDSGSVLVFISWLALYGVPAYAPPRQIAIVGVIVLLSAIAILAAMAFTNVGATRGGLVTALVLVGGYVATAWFLGRYHGTKRAYLAELEDRAARLASEQEAVAARATAEERARIARELHDMLAHTMSGMVVLAGGGRRVAETKPAAAAGVLAQIEEVGRKGMAETRMLLDSLRGDGMAPTLDDLSTLVERLRATGLPVEVEIEGEPVTVPLTVGVAAYRIVQESLTNVLRHAGPATARVGLHYWPDALEVRVADDGRGGPAEPGHGLAGMRERASLAGGELRAGPSPDGGWSVRAIFPVTP